jgi:hypothetical protein
MGWVSGPVIGYDPDHTTDGKSSPIKVWFENQASWWSAEELREVNDGPRQEEIQERMLKEYEVLARNKGNAKRTLEEIRDLARTSLAPMTFNMSEGEWAKHRLNRIAVMADRELDRIKGEANGQRQD